MAGKRKANGEGTIFQRADGRWCGSGFVYSKRPTAPANASTSTPPPAAKQPTNSPRNSPTPTGAWSWPPTRTSPSAPT
jgi:hypothetical protein